MTANNRITLVSPAAMGRTRFALPAALLLLQLGCTGGEPLAPRAPALTAAPVSPSGWATRAPMPAARGDLAAGR